jgi:tetratricopeptide (TPR) repeat protein
MLIRLKNLAFKYIKETYYTQTNVYTLSTLSYTHINMTNNNNNIYINTLIISIRGLLTAMLLLFSNVVYAQNQQDIQLANEYLLKGEKTKALELFRELAKNETNTNFIHNNYINLLVELSAYDEAHSYLKKILKKEPDNIHYRLDVGILYVRSGELTKAEKYFKEIIAESKTNVTRTKIIADYMSSKSLREYSVMAFLASREFLGNQYLFCLELATLYRVQGQREKMVTEYLNYVTQSSANIQYVKNVLQALLTKSEELETLETILFERVQKFPEVDVYSDLLIWVTMQQKNFNASFIQARAYDRRYKKFGEKCMEVARVALDNEDFETATKSYAYVVREYPSGPFFQQAELGLMKTKESKVKNSFPVNVDSVKSLIAAYEKFIAKSPENSNTHEAIRNEAMLYATHLDEKDKAIELLNALVTNPRTAAQFKAKVKLDLGDIYLLKGEPWESTLLFSQVEKTQVESPLGYEAKLRNAKLSYYKADFRLAQEHLDILKQATTREIANDAMELSMRIKENIAFDSAGEALKAYAKIELQLYQNKIDEALIAIENLKQGFSENQTKTNRTTFSNQTILDDVYWLEANIRMQKGEFEQAIKLLQKILDEYSDDVLSDDAYFLQGEIYERQVKNTERAKEIYLDFLTKYPGSVYAAEARKRYRMLRGDFVSQPAEQMVPEF